MKKRAKLEVGENVRLQIRKFTSAKRIPKQQVNTNHTVYGVGIRMASNCRMTTSLTSIQKM